MLSLRQRLQIVREARQSIEAGIRGGATKEEACDNMLAEMQAQYGADASWLLILELLLKLIALFL